MNTGTIKPKYKRKQVHFKPPYGLPTNIFSTFQRKLYKKMRAIL